LFSLEIEVSSRSIKLGEVLTVIVKDAEENKDYTIWLDDSPYPLYRIGTKTLRALIGFDFNFKKRNCSINISEGRVALERDIEKAKNKVLARALLTETEKQLWKGGFILPVSGRISGKYGERRIYKKSVGNSFLTWRGIHSGLDITTGKRGSPIVASNSGNCLLARNFPGEGNTVVIDHGHGVITTYFHLEKIFVKEGNFIKKEDVIGTIGSSGLASGPHLHFGFYIHSIPVDPLFFINKRL